MAKPDGTYYVYYDLHLQKNPIVRHGIDATLVGGSGTATLTVLAGSTADYSIARDITEAIAGPANFQATAGITLYAHVGDNADILSTEKYMWLKIVLATAGANDADYTIYDTHAYVTR